MTVDRRSQIGEASGAAQVAVVTHAQDARAAAEAELVGRRPAATTVHSQPGRRDAGTPGRGTPENAD